MKGFLAEHKLPEITATCSFSILAFFAKESPTRMDTCWGKKGEFWGLTRESIKRQIGNTGARHITKLPHVAAESRCSSTDVHLHATRELSRIDGA